MNDKPSINVKSEEWVGAILSFLYYFSILSAYYVIRPLRDQLAVEVGSEQLPWFFTAIFVATLVLTPLFAWGVSRWPRRVIMPFVNIIFIVCLLVFIILFNDQSLLSTRSLGILFFVWVSVFNLFVVSVFWSFMSDIWSDAQARRLYPIIALGGTAGAIMGPTITSNLVEVIGSAYLLGVSALLLSVAVVCVLFLGSWAHKHGVHRFELNNEAAVGGGIWDGLKQIFSNRFIGIMSLMMLLNDAIGTIAYVLITDYSGVTFPHDVIGQTRFAANMDLSANIIQIGVQLIVTRWLLVRYGAGLVFAVWGAIVVFISLTMAFINDPCALVLGPMPWVALVQILTRSLSYGMIQPARETLYTLVSRDIRYKGKNAVDTVVWRAGDLVSLSFINVFRGLGAHVAVFGVVWAVLAATSGWMGWRLANRLEREN